MVIPVSDREWMAALPWTGGHTRLSAGGIANQLDKLVDDRTPDFPSPDSLPGLTLADLAAQHSPGVKPTEAIMQRVLFKTLQTVARTVGCDAVLKDTSGLGEVFSSPVSKPDAASMAAGGPPLWTAAVMFWEFKLSHKDSKTWEALGQNYDRARTCFQYQPQRPFMLVATVTMSTIEVFNVSKAEHGSGLRIARTGLLPLSLDSTSPGLQWLVRILRTPVVQLGYMPAASPQLSREQQMEFKVGLPLGRGTGHGQPSLVWEATLHDGTPAVLKLSKSENEAHAQPAPKQCSATHRYALSALRIFLSRRGNPLTYNLALDGGAVVSHSAATRCI